MELMLSIGEEEMGYLIKDSKIWVIRMEKYKIRFLLPTVNKDKSQMDWRWK